MKTIDMDMDAFLYTQRGNHHEWFYQMYNVLIKCSRSICIHLQKKKKESTLNLSAFILPARQMMVYCWIRLWIKAGDGNCFDTCSSGSVQV